MDINGWHGLKQDLLKLKQEMLNSKTKDAGPMDFSSDHQLIMLMPKVSSNCSNKTLLDSSQTMLVSNLLKRLNPLPINCQHTATSSNKMPSRNSNPSLKSRETEQPENKFLLSCKTYQLNWNQPLPHSKNKKSMQPLHLPNTFQIPMLKLLG